MRELTYNEAALEAIAEEMRRDPKIFYMSTDAIGPLLREFGDTRIKTTPITEAAFTGIGIGAAGCGFRPIVDWRQVTFCFVAMDQIVNQAAKIHYMFGGQVTFSDAVPRLGRRRRQGRGAAFAIALFDVHECRRAEDVPALDPLRHEGAAEDRDPRQQPGHLVRIEPADGDEGAGAGRGLHDPARPGRRQARGQRCDGRRARLAGARGARRGRRAGQGGNLGRDRRPAQLVPLDAETIRNSVRKTGRLVIADEAGPTAGFSAEIAALATEDAATFARLKAPVKRVCALQVPIPYSPVLENHVFPDRNRIVAGVREVLDARRPAAAA